MPYSYGTKIFMKFPFRTIMKYLKRLTFPFYLLKTHSIDIPPLTPMYNFSFLPFSSTNNLSFILCSCFLYMVYVLILFSMIYLL